jgi:porphobilinogen deaminase
MNGSCRTPIGAHTKAFPDGRLSLTGLVARGWVVPPYQEP